MISLHVARSSSYALSLALRTTRRSSSLSLSELPIRKRLAPFLRLDPLLELELLLESESELPSSAGRPGRGEGVGWSARCGTQQAARGRCKSRAASQGSGAPDEVLPSDEVDSTEDSSLSSSLELACQNLDAILVSAVPLRWTNG